MGAYGATKYAVEALSDALRQEVAGFGIKVIIIIEPGFTATSLGEAADGHGTAGQQVPDAYAGLVASGARPLIAMLTLLPARLADRAKQRALRAT